jgi:hypothetical protein
MNIHPLTSSYHQYIVFLIFFETENNSFFKDGLMQILLLQLSRASNALSRKPLSTFTSVSFSLGESSACLRFFPHRHPVTVVGVLP